MLVCFHVACRQLLLVLAEELCSTQGDAAVTRMLKEIDLWLVPTLNPDGFAVHRRENKWVGDGQLG